MSDSFLSTSVRASIDLQQNVYVKTLPHIILLQAYTYSKAYTQNDNVITYILIVRFLFFEEVLSVRILSTFEVQ